jgi:hypothetical protein
MKCVCSMLEHTIEVGAPLYDEGRKDLCAELYRSVALELLAVLGDPFLQREMAAAEAPTRERFAAEAVALELGVAPLEPTSRITTSTEREAWSLRLVFDRILLIAVVLDGIGARLDPMESLNKVAQRDRLLCEIRGVLER